MSPFLRIVLSVLAASVVYGVLHDQVTARLSSEYFTLGHPDLGHPAIFHASSPTLLGLAWGIVATWWVGLFLGLALAVSARWGRLPKLLPGQLLRPVASVFAAMALAAVVGGVVSPLLVAPPFTALDGLGVAPGRQEAFVRAWAAHSASYGIGLLGCALVCGLVLRRRRYAIQ